MSPSVTTTRRLNGVPPLDEGLYNDWHQHTSLGALQALQLQVAAHSDLSDNDREEIRTLDASPDDGQMAIELNLMSPRNLPDKLPKAHHIDFLSQMEAILTAQFAPLLIR